MSEFVYFGKSDVGLVRESNEDTFFVGQVWDKDCLLALVADGVGGYSGGDVAASMARDSIYEYLSQNDKCGCLELLGRAVVYANNKIYEERQRSPKYAYMSCVLTAIIIDKSEGVLYMAHVGDTRLYRCFSGNLEKLSSDHSLVGYREEIGDLTEAEAMAHPMRNVISRDVGSKLLDFCTDYVELKSFPIQNGTSFMLCSDGLCDMVVSESMRAVLSMEASVEERVETMIEDAKNKGGKDNITVVVVDLVS